MIAFARIKIIARINVFPRERIRITKQSHENQFHGLEVSASACEKEESCKEEEKVSAR
jgi:hypothetical protein